MPRSLKKPSYIPSNPIDFFPLYSDLSILELYQSRDITALVRKFSTKEPTLVKICQKFCVLSAKKGRWWRWGQISAKDLPSSFTLSRLFTCFHPVICHPISSVTFFHPLLSSSVIFFSDCLFPPLSFPFFHPEFFSSVTFFIRSLFLPSLLSSLMSPLN